MGTASSADAKRQRRRRNNQNGRTLVGSIDGLDTLEMELMLPFSQDSLEEPPSPTRSYYYERGGRRSIAMPQQHQSLHVSRSPSRMSTQSSSNLSRLSSRFRKRTNLRHLVHLGHVTYFFFF